MYPNQDLKGSRCVMATIQQIAKAAGVSPATVSCVLRNKPPFSEKTKEKVLAAVKALEEQEQVQVPQQSVTIRDVANLAGVSISTVSNVLNGYPVGEESRARVPKAVAQLHYEPNIMGRSLRRERNNRIIAAVSNPHWSALQGIYGAADELGYEVILMHSGINRKEDFARQLEGGMAQGILFFDFFDESVVSQLSERGYVVQCGGCTDVKSVSAVRYDYEAAGYELTSELIRLGRKRIWSITGTSRRGEPISFLEQYHAGYLRAMAEHGLPVPQGNMQDWGDDVYLVSEYLAKDQYVSNMLRLPPAERPDAIIAPTGDGAALLIQALRRYHLQVPEDVAVAAALSSDNLHSTYPYVTAMQQDWNTLAYESVRLLCKLIQSREQTPERITLHHDIVLRGSTHVELYPFLERPLEL